MTQSASSALYGIDFQLASNSQGIMDFDPSMRTTTGRALLSQSLLCRLSTPRGSVIDCPNDGLDLRDLLSSGQTNGNLLAIAGSIQNEVLKDQRVSTATVNCSYVPQTATMTATIAIQSSYGPFTLVLSVSAVTVQILDANIPQAT
jgi:hypothetical protein